MPAGADRVAIERATASLAERDPVVAGLVERHGACLIEGYRGPGGHFGALVRAVVYQQLNGRAAGAIHDRVVVAAGGELTPAGLLSAGELGLRAAGLSNAKTTTILGLAGAAEEGTLRLDEMAEREDEEVVEHLVRLRGIGRWTAEMFLIFELGRLDVWPVGDYGVRKGFGHAYRLAEMPTPKALAGLGEPFRPYRTVLAWYCWQAASTVPPAAAGAE